MTQQILIVGLGRFGMALARALAEKGAEVLAVDLNPSLVEEAATFVTEAMVLNSTEENELARLDPKKRDASICAIGDDSKEASIICTALLRQMGSPLVVARAVDQMHYRILQLVGAHMVISPEQEYGTRFASRLLYQDWLAETNLSKELHLTEIKILPGMIGKNLIELALPKRYGILVAGIRRGVAAEVQQPSPSEPLQENDQLILVSTDAAIPNLTKGDLA